MRSVLVVDDAKEIRDSLAGVLKDEGYGVILAESSEQALVRLKTDTPDIVLLDIWMPGMDGVDALKEIRKQYPELPVVMISGHATIETAVKTTKLGAYDFIEKPLHIDKVCLVIEHALEQRRLVEENTALKEGQLAQYKIIGTSQSIRKLKDEIKRAAPANSWVLITGENGTGKELVARNLHTMSEREEKPFIAVNCAAIPEELIESELFGHEKGAFTGAISQKKGRFDMADKGTLFLDEIADMSLKTQAKILRILQEQNFERVGGTRKISVDVRVIAATNKNLEDEIKAGKFREDLYYRLNVIPFHVPPLRDRETDVPVFIDYYLQEFARQTAREVPVISSEAIKLLTSYSWPGNVRELKNLMERLVIMTSSGKINVEDIPAYIHSGAGSEPQGLLKKSLKDAKKEFEKEFIARKLDEFQWNVSRTANAIGIERSHLYRKIKSYGIEG